MMSLPTLENGENGCVEWCGFRLKYRRIGWGCFEYVWANARDRAGEADQTPGKYRRRIRGREGNRLGLFLGIYSAQTLVIWRSADVWSDIKE